MKPSREAPFSIRFNQLMLVLLALLLSFPLPASGSSTPRRTIISQYTATKLTTQAVYLTDAAGKLDPGTILSGQHNANFIPWSPQLPTTVPVHWMRFTLTNSLSEDSLFYANITFTDVVQLYEVSPSGTIRQEQTGDLWPLSQRPVSLGQMCFVHLYIPYGQTRTFYVRMESSTLISQQFKPMALQGVKLFPRKVFEERFINSRLYQALFYGACLIMLVYNFFLLIILRNRNYLLYLLYLLSIMLFFAANNGYLAEWLLAQHPRPDLYIRFFSTPVLVFFFLLFSRSFLQSSALSPKYYALSRLLLVCLTIAGLLMLAGYWWLGRYLVIVLAILVLLLVTLMAVSALLKKYSPARYFLVANATLILWGLVYAFQRFPGASGGQLAQYGIQIGVILELALFSLGLADSINLVRKELAQKQLENERLQLQKEMELKRLAEDKNRELEQRVIERTSEVVAQNEEIQAQNEQLAINYQELSSAQYIIQAQNEALRGLNEELEARVKDRTRELELTNTELEEAIAELDHFIYRTAHDIKGPLARLQGLTYVALLDISEEPSRSYMQKLYAESIQLNNILSRLSTIYDIKKQVLVYEPIDFCTLIEEIRQQELTNELYQPSQIAVFIRESGEFLADQRLIRFMLTNLLENALKFGKKASEQPHMVTVQVQTAADDLQITITDNGVGIDEQDVSHIFDLFSRSARVHKTAGLGLYMTRLSVERLGGTIRLLPDTKPLTVFEIRLPKHRPVQELPVRLFNQH